MTIIKQREQAMRKMFDEICDLAYCGWGDGESVEGYIVSDLEVCKGLWECERNGVEYYVWEDDEGYGFYVRKIDGVCFDEIA